MGAQIDNGRRHGLLRLLAVAGATVFLPLAVFAQNANITEVAGGWVNDIAMIIVDLVPFLVALCVLFFLWGAARFVLHAGDEKGREEGRRHMLRGLVALTVAVTLWGLVLLVANALGIGDEATQRLDIPSYPAN